MIRSLALAVVALLLVSANTRPATWSASDLAILRSLWIDTLGAPPPDPSNRVADNPQAAVFGQALFFDRGLSGNGRPGGRGFIRFTTREQSLQWLDWR